MFAAPCFYSRPVGTWAMWAQASEWPGAEQLGRVWMGPEIFSRVSHQGLHPSPSFSESFRETLLTAVKWDGLATRCFTLTTRFLPPRPKKVTTYATRCRYFLSFFLRCAKNLGIREATTDSSSESSKKREKKAALGGACELGQPSCNVVT